MGGNMAAFASKEQLNVARNNYPGEVLTWKNMPK
jgi:hypothetical protein